MRPRSKGPDYARGGVGGRGYRILPVYGSHYGPIYVSKVSCEVVCGERLYIGMGGFKINYSQREGRVVMRGGGSHDAVNQ